MSKRRLTCFKIVSTAKISKKGNKFNLEYFATNILHSEVADSDPYDCLIYRETLKELFDIVKEEANIYEDCLATSK